MAVASVSVSLAQPNGSPKSAASRANPAVAFIIGLAIITLASVLNAAGLNLTKLDHVSVSMRLAILCFAQSHLGSDKLYSKTLAEKGLGPPPLAARDVAIYVHIFVSSPVCPVLT